MFKSIAMMMLGMVFLTATTFAFAEDVYVTKHGKKFHAEECPLIKNKGAVKIAKKDALENGLTPCQKCFSDEVSKRSDQKKDVIAKKEKSK